MSLIERDKQFVWHPFTPQKNMADPIAIVKGKGSLLFDENGNSYIDAISSWWVNLHGHAHPYIAEMLYRQALQLEQVIFAGFTHQPAVDLAERLLQILPDNFSKIFYSDNGSTAVEVALKMAIQFWWNKEEAKDQKSKNENQKKSQINSQKRNKVLAFRNSYHGDTFGAMSVSDRSVFTLAFHDLLFEVIFIDVPCAENLKDLNLTVRQNAGDIAAFIYEPLVQGAGGMKMYEAYWLNELLNIVKQNNIICIADEVMTGFGRTGKIFASEHAVNKPDIISLSKGLTGGTMALGVTACTEKIYSAYLNDDKLKTFFHGHSFTANPLACTAALASLNLFQQENCLKKIDLISQQHQKFISRLSNKKNIKDIRLSGTIIAFEIDEGANEYLNNISSVITLKGLQQGVYIRPLGNTVYLMPPYCITENELNKVYDVLLNII
jgi:adenosylmethionine-8-amino-7-oxononanoate aminotransferase